MPKNEIKAGPSKSVDDCLSEARAVKSKYGDKAADSGKHQGSGKKLGK